jgi:hypothetical protein
MGDLRHERGLPAVPRPEVLVLRCERGLLTPQACLQTRTWVQPSPHVGRRIEDERVLARLPASTRSSGVYWRYGFFAHVLLRLSGRPRPISVPRPVTHPARRRCRTVATPSPSSVGPTTSGMAVIRSAKVIGRRDGFSAPDLALRTGLPAPRSTAVATSCPPTMPLP